MLDGELQWVNRRMTEESVETSRGENKRRREIDGCMARIGGSVADFYCTKSIIHPHLYPVIRLFTHWSSPSNTERNSHALTHARTHSLTHALTHSRTHALTHAQTQRIGTHSRTDIRHTHSLTHSRIHACTHARMHALTQGTGNHSLTHSLTHALSAHSLTHSLTDTRHTH